MLKRQVLTLSCLLTASLNLGAAADTTKPVTDFNRDVRPILSAKCFACHGPDEGQREADLRLDERESALMDRGGYAVITPGNPDESELVQRIISDDPDLRMPPADAGEALAEAEIERLRAWIAQGADYAKHWAFIAPQRRPLPTVRRREWARSPVDLFILKKQEEAGLQPSPPAEPLTLMRRVYFDLVGLPPTPEEVDAFQSDIASCSFDIAYERLVDRLLASPHYGQRWARRWLDLARYADTNGYEKDRTRQIWAYRDWVVDALNRDLPFDEFTVAQIAGDMLPDATLADRIATGFHRNSMLNEEGGIDPLEYRFHAMVDRMAVTGATWLGLTLHCCQCHSHKYDPISHQEYYQLMAFLNNADEPQIVLPDAEREAQYQQNLARAHELLEQLPDRWPVPDELKESSSANGSNQDNVRTELIEQQFNSWLATQRQQVAHWTSLEPVELSSNLPILTVEADDTVFVSGDITKHDTYRLRFTPNAQKITAIRLEALPDERLPGHGPGLTYYEGTAGDFFLGEFKMTANGRPVSFARASQSFAANQFGGPGSAESMLDGDLQTGWSVNGRQGERHVAVFVLEKPLESPRELTFTMDFGRHFACSLGRFRISVTSDETAQALDLPERVEQSLLRPPATLTAEQQRQLWHEFLLTAPELAEPAQQIRQLRKRPPAATTLVMRERPENETRPTYLHKRGEFLQPQQQVQPVTPAALHAFPTEQPTNRRGIAEWIVSPENPLTPRVVVNRHWAALFGAGLVRTTEDFGVQGEVPSHPELLDWLAIEFRSNGWSLKWLHRQLVLSATYRQSSRIRPSDLEIDPENRLLARQSRRRLEAEMIRDSVLRSAGLLSSKMKGPGVYPPQPAGVTEVAYGSPAWTPSEGEDRYRRSLYTFVKRTAPFAAYQVFDAPSGESCTARRDVSNTPLQGLTLMNDVVFTEAAQSLGRTISRQGHDDETRCRHLFRRVLTRWSDAEETIRLLEFVKTQRNRFASGQLDAQAVAGGDDADLTERATWTSLARVLFNLDEAITRN